MSLGGNNVDARLFRWVNRLAIRTGWAHGFFVGMAKYGIVLFAALLLAAWWSARHADPTAVVAVAWSGAAALVALGIAQVIGGYVDRARPYTAMPATHVLVSRSADFSFPSDHSTVSGAVAVGLLLAQTRWGSRRLGAIAAGVAVLLAFSRVYVGVHYPGDTIAGLALGAAVAAAGMPLATRLLAPAAHKLATTPVRPLLTATPNPTGSM